MNLLDNLGEIIFENLLYDRTYLLAQINYIRQKIRIVKLENNLDTVGILLRRNPMLISSMLAAFLEEIPFMLMDVEQPEERLRKMLDISETDYIITTRDIKQKELCRKQIVLDDFEAETYQWSLPMPQIDEQVSDKLAYLLFTSGTTGQPKAVEVKRRGLLNFIEAIPEVIEFKPHMKIACLTNVTFDIFLLESFYSLVKGLTIVLSNEEQQDNPKLISDLIIKHRIDMLQMTPSKMKLLNMYDKDLLCLQHVQTIMIGGEGFPESLLGLLQKCTNAKIYNMYGPTETTIWSSVSDLTNKRSIDIGYPIGNTQIYILDSKLNLVKEGEIGEICIAGHGLARGYRNNVEQTQRVFTVLPERKGISIYRTGDLGKYDEKGVLHCFGRIDNQIKLRGHRIELEDIDSNIALMDDMKTSVTCFKETSTGGELITYYIAEKIVEDVDIINYLKKKLPQYMIPHKYVHVSRFLYTTSGKIDRKAILENTESIKLTADSEVASSKKEDGCGKNSEIIATILDVIHSVLENDSTQMDCETELKELGIDSINFVKIIVQLEEEFEMEFDDSAVTLSAFGNVNEIAEYVFIHL